MASALQSEAPTAPSPKIHIGSRKSNLALVQTDHVLARLKKTWPSREFEVFASNTEAGDVDKVTSLKELTGKNIWTAGLESLLIAGSLHMIVHSLKDVPTNLPSTCTLGAILNREDPRDALVVKAGLHYNSISSLPEGSVIGTSSIRRCAQLARKYPHLKVLDMRGNIGTRLSKLDAPDSPFTALILAAAGLLRMNLQDRITEYLNSQKGMLHAVGQGALGVEVRIGDEEVMELVDSIADQEATIRCVAERSLLRILEGGCSAPLGVETEWKEEGMGAHGEIKGRLLMRVALVSVDGSKIVEVEREGEVVNEEEADHFGIETAEEMIRRGAREILEEIERNKRGVGEAIPKEDE